VSTHENERALDQDQQVARSEASGITDQDSDRKLPAELALQIQALQPDPQAVVYLCRKYPHFTSEILTQGAQYAGNSAVAQAVELLKDRPLTQAEVPVHGQVAEEDLSAEGFKYNGSSLESAGQEVSEADLVHHVAFIQAHPALRDKVLQGFAKDHPGHAAELMKRLRAKEASEGPTQPEVQVQAQPAPEPIIDAPTANTAAAFRTGDDASAENFNYINSTLSVETTDSASVEEHVRFIREHPHLRGQVLEGLGRLTPRLLDQVLRRLNEENGQAEKVQTERQAESETTHQVEAPKEEAKESPWVTHAKRFNAAHQELVQQFNQSTGDACVGADGELDPKLVSDWQASRGLQPDGRVGPATVEAAQRLAKGAAPQQQPDQLPNV
jgi:hypothetical protein